MTEENPAALDDVRAGAGWFWLDLGGGDVAEIVALCERLGFDRLATEDVIDEAHFPKVEDFGEYLFVVLHGLGRGDDRLVTVELDAFVGPDFLVTFHQDPVPALAWLAEQAQSRPAFAEGGPDLMLSRLAEGQARRYLPIIQALDDQVDEIEVRAVEGDPAVVGEVQALLRDASRLRRIVGPQREVLLTLSHEYSPVVSEHAQRRFGDVYDHHFRLVESLDVAKGMLAALLDTYRSTVAERMNAVMKVLTVYAAILLPLSLLAGIYGMNFANMPEREWRWGYFALLGVMAAVAIGQWIYFIRRGFIGRFRPGRIPVAVGKGLVHVAAVPIRSVMGVATELWGTSEAQKRESP